MNGYANKGRLCGSRWLQKVAQFTPQRHNSWVMYLSTNTKRPISFRQLRAVDLWLKYGRKSKARALREAGYSSAIYRQPRKVFSSPAVREELDRRGLGYDGLRDNLTSNGKPIAVIRPHIDFSALSQETLIKLKEQLGDITFNPPS